MLPVHAVRIHVYILAAHVLPVLPNCAILTKLQNLLSGWPQAPQVTLRSGIGLVITQHQNCICSQYERLLLQAVSKTTSTAIPTCRRTAP